MGYIVILSKLLLISGTLNRRSGLVILLNDEL